MRRGDPFALVPHWPLAACSILLPWACLGLLFLFTYGITVLNPICLFYTLLCSKSAVTFLRLSNCFNKSMALGDVLIWEAKKGGYWEGGKYFLKLLALICRVDWWVVCRLLRGISVCWSLLDSLYVLLGCFYCWKEHMDMYCKGFPQSRNERADLYSNVDAY